MCHVATHGTRVEITLKLLFSPRNSFETVRKTASKEKTLSKCLETA
jgi:hypothetical protein